MSDQAESTNDPNRVIPKFLFLAATDPDAHAALLKLATDVTNGKDLKTGIAVVVADDLDTVVHSKGTPHGGTGTPGGH